ncbi:MAG: Na/Pi cotransporter family protein [Eubacteriales bacterium]
MDIFSVFTFLGGLAFFLFGMNVMSGNLEKMAGGKLESMLKKMTAKPVIGLFLGLIITVAIQSSSATTVMLVGLVNSGIMTFNSTIHVIFGANIGTTMTAWLLSLSGIDSSNFFLKMLKPDNFAPLLAFIGLLMIMGAKSDRKKSIGSVMVGFGVLMFGMDMMEGAVSPLAEMPQFADMMVNFSNPFLGVIVGALFTALIQSSSASVGVLQALAVTGVVTNGMALPIIMGQNIGTCITALLSSIGANKNARRVSIIHVAINTLGTIIFLILYYPLQSALGEIFMNEDASRVSIAIMHSAFNISVTLLLMPFAKYIGKLAVLIVPDSAEDAESIPQCYLDSRLLSTPSIAIVECESKAQEMARLAQGIIVDSIILFEDYSEKKEGKLQQKESQIDSYEDRLGSFLVQISGKELSNADTIKSTKILHALGDFERLGDHALNLAQSAKEIHDKQLSFSANATKELKVLTDALTEIMDISVRAYNANDVELAKQVEPLEQVIDRLIERSKLHHVERLQAGRCTIELGFILSDILTNYERISDHCSNIAVCVIETAHSNFDAHEYLQSVKSGSDSQFTEQYKIYREKYKYPL